MFKRGDYYYIIHGDLCCFCTRGSDAKVLMSKSPMGPYTEVGAINTYNEHHLAVQNNGIIKVKDQYGDYGISGFYLKKDNELIHFLFSCRTMNMYIESWLYKKLNSPKIIGHSEEVALVLNTRQDLSFINNKSSSASINS